jgi:hypothetical protein
MVLLCLIMIAVATHSAYLSLSRSLIDWNSPLKVAGARV